MFGSARGARRGVRRFALELIAHPAVRARLERRINRYVESCGCGTGAVFVAAGVIGIMTSAVQVPGRKGLVQIAAAVGIVLALGLVGKIIGLLIAEYQLRRAIDQADRARLTAV